jgi:hypothetical protein
VFPSIEVTPIPGREAGRRITVLRNGVFMSRACRVELPGDFGNACKWPETNANKTQHVAT